MTQRRPFVSVLPPPARAWATPALLAASALALAACGQHAYPGSSEPPPPPPPPADLMGAPDGAGPPPAPPQAYAPAQPGLEAPAQPNVGPGAMGPDGSAYPPPPGYGPQGYGRPQGYAGYPPGRCPPRAERTPADGCMDPIPNPPEDGRGYRHRYVERERGYVTPYPHHHRHVAYGHAPVAPRPAMHRGHGHGLYRYVPYHAGHATHAAPMHTASTHGSKAVNVKPATHPAGKPAHAKAAETASSHAPSSHAKGVKSGSPSLRAPVVPDAKAGEASGPAAALAAALVPVVKARAVLHADGLKPNQPGDVSLVLPPDFADGLRAEAKKNGLTDAAASANLTAALAGEGYAVTPSTSQSLPLVSGQATTFKWTVTPQAGANGPLRASVGADLLGGGVQHVDLGSVDAASTPATGLSAKAIGWTLLGLIVLIVGGLFAGRRRKPAPAVVRTDGRPLDLNGDRRS